MGRRSQESPLALRQGLSQMALIRNISLRDPTETGILCYFAAGGVGNRKAKTWPIFFGRFGAPLGRGAPAVVWWGGGEKPRNGRGRLWGGLGAGQLPGVV